jgi:hypothetical protein
VSRPLAIYLNDHLAGATAGAELSKRAAGNNPDAVYGVPLRRLAVEIDEDRATLLAIMRELGVRVDRVKVAGGWVAEKLGRLKLNGGVLGYTPLSRVVELEGLTLGVHGKLTLWRRLDELEPGPPGLARFDLATQIRRAQLQIEQLDELRRQSTTDAFAVAATSER